MLLADSQLQLIKVYLKSRPVLKAYLFGSYARKEAGEESDVDILLDLDHSQRIGLQFVQMKLDLERLLQVKVDLVSSSGLSRHIRPFIERERRLNYAR